MNKSFLKNRLKGKAVIFIIVFLFYCLPLSASQLSDYIKAKCIIHLHTDISSGQRTLESYVKEAKEKGIGAIVVTDDDWQRWEFGLRPFAWLIKKAIQKKSVMTFGIEKYLKLIDELNKKYKGVIVVDGVQTNPFYFWKGNYFKGTLSINDRNKDMLVVGLGRIDTYRNMPTINNHRGRFDAYHGDKFTRPYQDLIDYVIKKEGLIFWSHPEFEENTVMEGINLITTPYQWDLVGTHNYTGFGVFWEGYKQIGRPGGIWDRALTEYCQGRRSSPVWAIGELEEDGSGSINLDDIVNVVFIKKLDRQQILDALRKGRFYVAYKEFERIPLALEEFTLSDQSGTKTVMMGEEVSFSGEPLIRIRISHEHTIDKDITVKLIRNNEIIKEFSSNSKVEVEYKDQGLVKGQKYYYRIDVISGGGYSHLISNPIFFSSASDK